MATAEGKLQAAEPDGALPPEQKALQILQKAEEEYRAAGQRQQQRRRRWRRRRQQRDAQELADLFELELDKMANQYETAQRSRAAAGSDQQVDELPRS